MCWSIATTSVLPLKQKHILVHNSLVLLSSLLECFQWCYLTSPKSSGSLTWHLESLASSSEVTLLESKEILETTRNQWKIMKACIGFEQDSKNIWECCGTCLKSRTKNCNYWQYEHVWASDFSIRHFVLQPHQLAVLDVCRCPCTIGSNVPAVLAKDFALASVRKWHSALHFLVGTRLNMSSSWKQILSAQKYSTHTGRLEAK